MQKFLDLITIYILDVWNLELLVVKGMTFTFGNLFTAIVLLILGFWLSLKIKKIIGKKLYKHLNITRQQAIAFETVIYYVSLIFITLIALHLADIPLTALTILGSAVLIGVGFGSQNVVNNFMSGLIILIERPIKVGDIIEIENLRGIVETVGSRSTKILSIYNTKIIVPNSTILSNSLVNWTFENKSVLIDILIGIEYDSNIDKVKELLIESVTLTPRALSNPEPLVIFNNFGSSSLEFILLFHIHMESHLQRMIIESDVRYNINKLLVDNNISIAFPQQDVHMNLKEPVEIKQIKN